MSPVVVVDESHNAKSELSVAMLRNLNPSFVLSMTATPTERANVISCANARELKRENMVKLPVVVYNRPDRASVIRDAVALRGVLERKAAALRIPQFMLPDDAGLFGDPGSRVRLSESDLMEGFALSAKAADVAFNPGLTGAMKVDLSETGDVTPKCRLLSKAELDFLAGQLAGKSDAERLGRLVNEAAAQLDLRTDFCEKAELADYVRRVVAQLPPAVRDQLSAELLPPFVQCVRDRIDALVREHKRAVFRDRLNANAILCEPNYALPPVLQTPRAITYVEKSLYTGECDDMNGDELEVVQAMTAKDGVRWWHRIRERRGFCINGFINHYPDFMVMTERGTFVLVEVKGPHLDGSDSQAKAELGRAWADSAGRRYKYFMVFLKDGDAVPGALKIDAFLNTLERL